jgi:hypothetical protein
VFAPFLIIILIYGSQTKFVRHTGIVIPQFLIVILIIPLSASILSVPFLGDALIKLYETL